jgi:uncharacterized Zn-finger protein
MEHRCDICKKQFKTYKTLWKHNRQFHVNSKDDIKTTGIH